jgi:uncharacterized protein YjbI with pentapeptide repeats
LAGRRLGYGIDRQRSRLYDADLFTANLSDANLARANLINAEMEQSQLDQACGVDAKLPAGMTLKPCPEPK